MCRVVVKDSKQDAEFIIYNHLFSRPEYQFTISKLVEDLQAYNLNLSEEDVQAEIDGFVQSGLINQNFRCYTTCRR